MAKRRSPILAIAIALAALAIVGILVGRSRPAKAPEQVLRIASQKGSTKALLLASGVLDGAPYRVEWAEFPAAQHLLEALGAGAVDVGVVGDAPFQSAYQSGSPIVAVQAIRFESQTPMSAIIVPGSSSLKSDQDLRGKKIATGRGSAGHYLLLRALEKAGLKPDDVTTVFLAPADANAAFSSGAVDAWSTWNPYVAANVLHSGARILVEGNGLYPGTGFVAANADARTAKRALIEDFLKRHARSLEWASTHVDEGAAVLSKDTGLPLDVARYTLNRRQEAVSLDEGILVEQRDVLAHFVAAGTLQAKRDFAQGFDGSLFHPERHASLPKETP